MVVVIFAGVVFGQQSRIQIADGTVNEPARFDLQPDIAKLEPSEIERIRKFALAKDFSASDSKAQMSSEESNFFTEFSLHDVAEGFFVSREFESRAYLYTAYSRASKRNYHGIIVVSAFDNDTRFKVERHVVYGFRGDKHIRTVSDLNANFFSELAVFGFPPDKKRRLRWVRLLEFGAGDVKRIGAVRIHSSQIPASRREKSPGNSKESSDRTTSKPQGEGLKVFFIRKPMPGLFIEFESWRLSGDIWEKADNAPGSDEFLVADMTAYIDVR